MSRHTSQDACPYVQRFTIEASEPDYAARGPGEAPHGVEPPPGNSGAARQATHPGTDSPSLVELLRTALDPEAWDAFSRGSAIRRAGRAGFARNVCVAMGSWLAEHDEPPEAAVAVLRVALEEDDPLLREHAGWALGRR